MMMMGLHFTGEVPFREVYITPLIRDQYGKKMTKSRGNVVDPLAVMETYGTDAMRFTLAQLTVQGRDLVLADDRLAASRAFANKIWNAARFVLLNLKDESKPIAALYGSSLSLADRWILGRLALAIEGVRRGIDGCHFNEAARILYQFVWHAFCDWYIELAKEPLAAGGARRAASLSVLVHCFDQALRLLHPFMPFLTEELWQTLKAYLADPQSAKHIVVASYPEPDQAQLAYAAESGVMSACIAVTEAINAIRAVMNCHPGQRVRAFITQTGEIPGSTRVPGRERSRGEFESEFAQWKPYAATLAKLQSFDLLAAGEKTPVGVVTQALGWCEVSVKAPEGFDFAKTRSMLEKKLYEVSKHHEQHLARLASQDFVTKAAPETQEQTRERAEELSSQRKLLEAQLDLLASAV